jgi:branched-chain amino acid transport system substrate-binding protein
VRKVVVVTDDSAFTRGIETEFRQHFEFNLGGEIVVTIHTDVKYWETQLSDALHAHEPQGVYVVGHGESTLRVLERLHEIHYGGVRCTTSSLYLTHVISRGGAAAEGVVFPLTAFDVASENDPVHGFVDRFRRRFGEPPDIYAAHGYDAMRVAIRTMVHAKAQRPQVLRQYMTIGLQDFTGVTGAVAFDERGDVRRYPVMHQIWNQRVVRSSWLRDLRDRKRKEIIESMQPEPTPQA